MDILIIDLSRFMDIFNLGTVHLDFGPLPPHGKSMKMDKSINTIWIKLESFEPQNFVGGANDG